VQSVDLSFDVSASVPLPGAHALRATLFVPDATEDLRVIAVAEPGGTYTRAYWHMEVAGHPGYSMAEYFADRGIAVLSLDHLGVGASSRPHDMDSLRIEMLAAANHALVEQLRAAVASGTLSDALPARPMARFVGIGHSLGGCVSVIQQGNHASFDALAVLGWSNLMIEGAYVPHENEAELTAEERRAWIVEQLRRRSENRDDLSVRPPRRRRRERYYGPEVPDAVVEADLGLATTVPRSVSIDVVTPGIAASSAALIEVPVMVAMGEADVSPDPHREVTLYPGSTDVGLFVLERSAHCHNFAPTRARLWQRLLDWFHAVL
jgi:alpha-beta hydrolase superfamily lysophospholipase